MTPCIMFHHFTDNFHPKIQGALSSNQFENIIQKLLPIGLVSATEWERLYLSGELKNEFCFTFDDNLKSQVDIAFPIMLKYKLNAFFFVYTTPFLGKIERLELYRFYRNIMFNSVDDFYTVFLSTMKLQDFWRELKHNYSDEKAENYYSQIDIYTKNDRIFRYLRDEVLGESNYFLIMDKMINDSDFMNHKIINHIFLNVEDLKKLVSNGNIIGLHSQYHPTNMGKLPKENQLKEYTLNLNFIQEKCPSPVISMSHPSNSYNADTIEILKTLGIKYGFRSMNDLKKFSPYELPRIDYLYIEKQFEISLN